MIIPHRKPCLKSQINIEGTIQELKTVINDLLYFKKDISILPSGNASIYLASKIIKDLGGKNILVPDMGGWNGFISYPKMFGLDIFKIKTNFGVIDCELLSEEITKKNIDGLFLTSLAGYLARQPLEEIKKICGENEILFIEDISGGVGGICGFGDIVVCSTGSPKIINCEYGGFIGLSGEVKSNLKGKNKTDELKNLLKTYKVPNMYGSIKEEALMARATYKKLVKFSKTIKDNFGNAYFKDKEGISVFLECTPSKEMIKKINECIELDNGKSIITKCPIYERILRNGIVIELKKIDIHGIDEDIIDYILSCLDSAIK